MHRTSTLARHSHGISLVQLLLAVGIIATLAGIALPTFKDLLDRIRADQVRMQLLSAFAAARSTAITRRHPVSVCASDDGQRCAPDWAAGWLIYLDPMEQAQPAAREDVLHYQRGTRNQGVHAVGSAGRPALRFAANGRSFGSNLTVAVCVRGRRRAEVRVNNSGRARSQTLAEAVPCP
ncbi:GspH/FimT family pseudopilin [Stenotrophomonas rhizophila]|uniref:GspH/FimT family pseudopilin n=1 Tax=Stenotrophomonas rhizophila TaxID=216778 RepID=UPI000B893C60|nr:GspH/FimT family pseudopilin [Stenotrophomonas rhizophila]